MANEILKVLGIKKYFPTPGGALHAVDDISFTIETGRTLGVVGESGCGKSTLGRVVLGLIPATNGSVIYDGRDITHLKGAKRRELCRELQIIFQDPFSSLNPRYCVEELIADPLLTMGQGMSRAQIRERVYELMDLVGVARRFAYSYPHELDGGRRQRVGIARALALNPRLIVCDEPVSALDVSIQAQVLNLLQDLQDKYQLTYIFITHDISVVKHVSNDIMVMYLGCMVEKCDADELFVHTLHPYSKGLLSAVPNPDIDAKKDRILLQGEITSPIEPGPGCRFAPRCPYATEKCWSDTPALEEAFPAHFVACHHVKEINGL